MCGIAGISLSTHQPVPGDMLSRMAQILAHRGPDGSGLFIHENAGIVHRRLSIIDVAGGQQPIPDATGKVQIAVNGEIYNFKALRESLIAEGVSFRTESDSEVPLHLYLKHGLDFVRHLSGMFAIAILDSRQGDLILARDPVGIKPLYTASTDAGIAFASEPSALTGSGWCPAMVNYSAMPALLNRQFISGADTLFAGVKRVLPGEVLRIRNGKVLERITVPLELNPASEISEAEALEKLDTLLKEKVRLHQQSDVPYGTFLSGGIDSSAVVISMAEATRGLRTYTIGFESFSVADERTQAEALARKLDTFHTSVEFSERDFWHYLPQMCKAMDDLATDYATLPTLKLAQCAHFDVKVVLSGEGGDEIFAGYGRYRRQSFLRRILGRPFRGKGDADRFGQLFKKPHEYAGYFERELSDQYYRRDGFTQLQGYQARDISEWLAGDLMLKVDRCLMAHGIEGRVPLLDKDLLAFAFALPDKLKIRRSQGKWLLKAWLNKRHPETQPFAPKRGFTVPIHEWMERKREKIAKYLLGHAGITPIIVPEKLSEWLSKPLDKKSAKLLFSLLCFAVWHDIHIDGKVGEWKL